MGHQSQVTEVQDEGEAQALLRAREATGLYVPLFARLLFLVVGLLTVGVELFLEDDPGGEPLLSTLVFGSLIGTLLVNLYLLSSLRRGRHVGRVGLAGAVFDGLLVVAMSQLAQLAGALDGLSPGFVFKTELPVAVLALVAINGLALRPRYPLIVGAGAVIGMLVPGIRALMDPTVQFTTDRIQVYGGAAFDPEHLVMTTILVIGTAAAVSYSALAARQTVQRGIAQELENARMQREQLALVTREKVKALSGLVAGISHEINTPLGALNSSADTQDRVLQRLAGLLGEGDGAASQAKRLLGVGQQTLATIRSASERIAAVESSLRALSHVDEGDLTRVDLNQELDNVVEVVRREQPAGTVVTRDLGALPNLTLNAQEVNQALLTIITNAFQAAGPDGEVTVTTRQVGDAVRIGIRDTGQGVPEEVLPRLFDVSFKGKDGRMTVGVGLATAQSIALRHGGQLEVDTRPGHGTTFTLQLPCPATQTAVPKTAKASTHTAAPVRDKRITGSL